MDKQNINKFPDNQYVRTSTIRFKFRGTVIVKGLDKFDTYKSKRVINSSMSVLKTTMSTQPLWTGNQPSEISFRPSTDVVILNI